MQYLIAILMYLGVITSPAGYSDADIQVLAKENREAISSYRGSDNNPNADATTSVTITKTVWDHEQL
jgi:hypothetical protein